MHSQPRSPRRAPRSHSHRAAARAGLGRRVDREHGRRWRRCLLGRRLKGDRGRAMKSRRDRTCTAAATARSSRPAMTARARCHTRFTARGLLSSPGGLHGLESYGEAGPGKYITIYANSEHAYMVVDGKRFDTVALAEDGSAVVELARRRTAATSWPDTPPGCRATAALMDRCSRWPSSTAAIAHPESPVPSRA